MRFPKLLPSVLGLVLLPALAALPARGAPEEEGAGKDDAPAVDAVLRFPGRVAWVRTAALSAAETGVLVELRVETGERVRRGQPLASIDDKDARLAVRAAELDVEAARIALHQSELRSSEAEAAYAEARVDLDRYQHLAEEGRVDQATLEGAQRAVKRAQAEQEKADLAARQARVGEERARTALEAAQLRLERTRITAPFDGVVVGLDRTIGESVRAHRDAIVMIADTERLQVKVRLANTDPGVLAPGAPVHVVAATGEGDGAVPGRVQWILPAGDGSDALEASVALERAPPSFYPGLPVVVLARRGP